MRTQVNGQVLELHTKNKDGKTYTSLVMYEFGKDFPELIRINVYPDKVKAASDLVNNMATVIAEMRTYQWRISFSFEGGEIRKAS